MNSISIRFKVLHVGACQVNPFFTMKIDNNFVIKIMSLSPKLLSRFRQNIIFRSFNESIDLNSFNFTSMDLIVSESRVFGKQFQTLPFAPWVENV